MSFCFFSLWGSCCSDKKHCCLVKRSFRSVSLEPTPTDEDGSSRLPFETNFAEMSVAQNTASEADLLGLSSSPEAPARPAAANKPGIPSNFDLLSGMGQEAAPAPATSQDEPDLLGGLGSDSGAPPSKPANQSFDPFSSFSTPSSQPKATAPSATSDVFGDFGSFDPFGSSAKEAKPTPPAPQPDMFDPFAPASRANGASNQRDTGPDLIQGGWSNPAKRAAQPSARMSGSAQKPAGAYDPFADLGSFGTKSAQPASQSNATQNRNVGAFSQARGAAGNPVPGRRAQGAAKPLQANYFAGGFAPSSHSWKASKLVLIEVIMKRCYKITDCWKLLFRCPFRKKCTAFHFIVLHILLLLRANIRNNVKWVLHCLHGELQGLWNVAIT